MTTSFEKIASEAPDLVREAGNHMRKVATALVVSEKLAKDLGHELQLHKLARRMEQRGIESGLDFETKLARLSEIPREKLAAFEQGIELAAAGGGFGAVMSAEDKLARSTTASAETFGEWIAAGGHLT